MNILKASAYILIMVLLSSCSEKGVDRYSWLIGNWEGNNQEVKYFVNWKKTNEETLSGDTYVFQNGDTIFREKNKIEMIGGLACFILSLPESKEPLTLRLTSEKDQKLVFESNEHPYPKIVIYEMSGDSLHVVSAGDHDNKKVKEEAYFHKK